MDKQDSKNYKATLIYLYEKFNGNQNLILKELVENNLKAPISLVKGYIKENNLKAINYTAFWEKRFPKAFKNYDMPVFIIHNKLDKSVKKYLDYVLEDDATPNGGISHQGETLRDFLEECGLGTSITLRDVNELLIENGIKPIKW